VLWSPNTQLHYPFQNTATDYSGNARNGTVNGSGVYATKPNGGRCLYFDGVGDYVETPSFGMSGTVVVFAADVRCREYEVHQVLFSSSAPFLLLRLPSPDDHEYLRWYYWDPSQQAAAAPLFPPAYEDVWLHLCVACDYAGKMCYFYRNGVFIDSVVLSGTPVFPTSSATTYLGSYTDGISFLLQASYLANVQLWSLATMPAAAQMLANAKRLMLGFNPIW